jgi:hypothetical protein
MAATTFGFTILPAAVKNIANLKLYLDYQA